MPECLREEKIKTELKTLPKKRSIIFTWNIHTVPDKKKQKSFATISFYYNEYIHIAESLTKDREREKERENKM